MKIKNKPIYNPIKGIHWVWQYETDIDDDIKTKMKETIDKDEVEAKPKLRSILKKTTDL